MEFRNAKIRNVYTGATTTGDWIVKQMARRDSTHRVGPGRCSQSWLGVVGHIKDGATKMTEDFENAKIGDVSDCTAQPAVTH